MYFGTQVTRRMNLKGLLKQWLCQIIGLLCEPLKIPLGYYHDLEICARCKMTRLISETFSLKTFREWEGKS